MINILVVEDNEYKLDTVKKLLTEDLMIGNENVDIATSIKGAKKLLYNKSYDLLILDLVLPLELGDQPTPEKGAGFLSDINSNPNLNAPAHIIGLTQYEEFQSRFSEHFSTHLWYLINYDASSINWQDKLKNLVNHLLNIRNSYNVRNLQTGTFDVAIITALSQPEFDKVLDLSADWVSINSDDDPVIYQTTDFVKDGKRLKVVAASVDQMGVTASASLTTKIVLKFRPKYIFMCGICAGLKDRGLNFGDVLIADQSWDYGSGKMKDVEGSDDVVFEPDPRPIILNPDLRSKVNNFLRKADILSGIQNSARYHKPPFALKARMGPIASGSYVIASSGILDDIKAHNRKLLGVEMEGYGLYYSAQYTLGEQAKAMMVKSVSDFGDNMKNDDFQDYAAYTSVQFVFKFIMEELI